MAGACWLLGQKDGLRTTWVRVGTGTVHVKYCLIIVITDLLLFQKGRTALLPSRLPYESFHLCAPHAHLLQPVIVESLDRCSCGT